MQTLNQVKWENLSYLVRNWTFSFGHCPNCKIEVLSFGHQKQCFACMADVDNDDLNGGISDDNTEINYNK